jgi:YD repeat-containing protein
VGYGYDLAGNRTRLVYPNGKVVTYTYDADNRLLQVEDWDGGLTSYTYDAAGRLISETLPNGVDTTRQYDAVGRLIRLTHTAPDDSTLSEYVYKLDGVGNRTRVTETLTQTARVITNVYDALNRLTGSVYSTGESFAYVHDAVGNRTLVTNTTPLSGTVVTTYTYDAANRLTNQVRSDGRSYIYTWSARGQLLAEWIPGVPMSVREFSYDGAGRMIQARVFTLTTRFAYDGDRARRTVEVVGHSTTTYTLDYGRGNRVLAEETVSGTLLYLYGHDCLGQYDDAEDEWLYYLNDAIGYVRQGADEQGQVVSSWLFDPDGAVLEGPQGLVSHLICGGVYDWSTGLIFKGGRYFDPTLGIWLALAPLVVAQSWWGRKRKRRGMLWCALWMLVILTMTVVVGCDSRNKCKIIDPKECVPTMPTSGSELPFEPDIWNDGGTIQESNNCYSYALNDPDGHPVGGSQPGLAAGRGDNFDWPINCTDIRTRAIADGLLEWDCDQACKSGFYKVALVVDGTITGKTDTDYHWYRQNKEGCWSHKRGQNPVCNTDASHKLIVDPRTANRDYGQVLAWDGKDYGGQLNYDQFCGDACFCVPAGGIRTAP